MEHDRGGPRERPAMRAVWALGLAVLGPTPGDRAGGAEVVVGPNVHVSRERAEVPHREVILAADPSHPGRLLAGSMIAYKGELLPPSVAYASEDDGKTWRLSLDRKSAEDRSLSGDPAVAFGPDGTAYFATLARRGLFRSRDGGRTWEPPTAVDPEASLDREFLAVDGTGGRFRGRLYWSCANLIRPIGPGPGTTGIALYASGDGGLTFDRPALRVADLPLYVGGIGNGVVLSDGTFVVLYNLMEPPSRAGAAVGPNARLGVGRSTDGGRTFEREMPEIDSWTRGDHRAGAGCLAVGLGGAATGDRLYAAWADGGPTTPYRVMFSRSEDKGLSWTPPRAVSELPEGAGRGGRADAYLPALAVNRAGVVCVTWYDTREIPAGRGWHVLGRASRDGGRTWLPTVRVTELATKVPGPQDWPGDTAGLAADAGGTFHALWIDGRTGVLQVWTAALAVGME